MDNQIWASKQRRSGDAAELEKEVRTGCALNLIRHCNRDPVSQAIAAPLVAPLSRGRDEEKANQLARIHSQPTTTHYSNMQQHDNNGEYDEDRGGHRHGANYISFPTDGDLYKSTKEVWPWEPPGAHEGEARMKVPSVYVEGLLEHAPVPDPEELVSERLRSSSSASTGRATFRRRWTS